MNIVLEGVTKRYGDKTVLCGLNALLPEGEVTVMMGPSGCGKTTLLRLLLRLEAPDEGRILNLPQRSAAVFQEDRLCPEISAAANLSLVCDLPRSALHAQLLALGLDDAAIRAPAKTLSGGEARRVAILRCLLAEAELLIFDEPLKGLDEAMQRRVLREIALRRAGRTMVWVTHDAADADFWQGNCLRLLARE